MAEARGGPSNFPSFTIAPQLLAILRFGFLSIFSVWTDMLYLTIAQIFSQSITVLCSVTNQTLWAAFGSSQLWLPRTPRMQCLQPMSWYMYLLVHKFGSEVH
jgi:hypothetical protein